MKQVKKTFKPEFLNRLSGAVVFRDMDKQMATLILQKKLRELDAKLAAKQVKMTLTAEAFDHLLKEGFTAEYGAREMDRVIAQQLKAALDARNSVWQSETGWGSHRKREGWQFGNWMTSCGSPIHAGARMMDW